MILKMPISLQNKCQIEIKKPDSDTILNIYEKAEQGKYAQALLSLMHGGIVNIEDMKPSLSDLKNLPLVSAEYIAKELFKLYKLPTLVEGLYPCPRNGCGNRVIHEESRDFDSRDDVDKLQVVYAESPNYQDDWFVLNFDKGDEIQLKQRDDVVAEISSITFRDPTIGDLINVESDSSLTSTGSRLRKLYHELISGVSVITVDDRLQDVQTIKNRYPYDLVKYSDYRYMQQITVGLRRFGIYPFIELVCPSCGKQWETALDFTSFFVYALRSQLGMAKS